MDGNGILSFYQVEAETGRAKMGVGITGAAGKGPAVDTDGVGIRVWINVQDIVVRRCCCNLPPRRSIVRRGDWLGGYCLPKQYSITAEG